MMLRASVSLLFLTTVFAIGCNNDKQTVPVSAGASQSAPAAYATASSVGSPASASDSGLVKQAVEDHLRTNKGINMSAMDMTVDSVTVDGDHAQANTTFKVKGGGATMAMVYSLERHGSGWLVLKSQPSNGEFVHPPMDKIHSGAAAPAAPASGAPDVTDFLKSRPTPSN